MISKIIVKGSLENFITETELNVDLEKLKNQFENASEDIKRIRG